MRANMKTLVKQQGANQPDDPRPFPLPYGGVNEVDDDGTLKANEARYVMNWYPLRGDLVMRNGYTKIVKGRTAPVSVVGYELPASAGALLFDADGWALGIAEDNTVSTVMRNCGVSTTKQVMAATVSDTLCMVDGVNAGIKHWTGSGGITSATLTGDYAAYVWAGIVAHNNRIYLWRENDLNFYYLNTDSIQGEVKRFPLSFLGRLTGSMRAIASWSTDAGQGTNDLFVGITTTGSVVVYEGTDPGDSLNWRINGVYKMSEMPGADGWVNIGGDLRIATKQGVVSAAEMLTAGPLSAPSTQTPARKVVPSFIDAAEIANKERYWQALIDPKGHGVWFNLPTASGSKQVFFSTYSLQPFFFDLPAVEFAAAGSSLWFTDTSGNLCAYGGYSDAGTIIEASWHSDWLEPGGRGAGMIDFRPYFGCASDVWLTIAALADYRESAEAIAEAEQDWNIVNIDGIADEMMPLPGEGDRIQLRMTVENRNVEEVKWKSLATTAFRKRRSR